MSHRMIPNVPSSSELTADMGKLRAELERVKAERDDFDILYQAQRRKKERASSERDDALARAEKAEADNVALRGLLDELYRLCKHLRIGVLTSRHEQRITTALDSPNPGAGILAVYNAVIEWERDMRERGATVTSWDVPLLRAVRSQDKSKKV